ncbi:MAG: DUF4058 family protein [Planctomycetes bacterium]|nr:DUF4058 family protein [Planctomycetota bacterium]
MASPFPGMDPYLEAHWRSVHTSFIVYARDRIQERLPSDLRAEVEERVFVEFALGTERSFRPDVHVVETGGQASDVPSASGVATAQPLVLELPPEEVAERFLNIIDIGSGRQVVTTLELLSPSNKLPGEGQEKFRQKQRECLSSRVNLVEIDLVRVGKRVLLVPPDSVPPSHRTTYQACIRRGRRPWAAEVYRIPLRERLPALPIPLREADADIPLDLQELIDRCYQNGRHEGLDYTAALDPPLGAADAAWADALLRSSGKR